ncbi:MAG: AAA family ATPase [Oscillospiraceae bacterium]|nr:AAA family ATPase [Oscillospiraceae bacterium]
MGNFMQYFFQDFGRLARAFWEIFTSFFHFFYLLLNFPERMRIIQEYSPEFTTTDWILMLVANIVLLFLIVMLIIGIVKLLRRIFRFRIPVKKYDALVKQMQQIQRDLLRANYEKDRLLNMKITELGLNPDQVAALNATLEDESKQAEEQPTNRNTLRSPIVDPNDSRFFRLTMVDNYYKREYEPPEYDNTITLEEFCDRFRRFSAGKLGLYYDIELMRYFVAALATTRIVILQGISGTGKTSLAYAFGKFVQKDTTLVPVQPAWRERTELYGYYNEFTKKYTETEFLRAIYEGNYYPDPHVIILDEMNIARVEYYFAELLSILEMPRHEDWKIDIVSAVWDNDPCLIKDGVIQINDNTWFVGTINNDDSTFAVADKVYDRAVPIDLDSRADPFTCEPGEPVHITTRYLQVLFDEAKSAHPLSQEMEDKLDQVNTYLITNFRLAFGNRIIKQMRDFVPVYIACGGTEIEAVDFMMAKKVLRKFESLSLGFMKDQLSKFQQYLDHEFGRDAMKICKSYVEFLKRNN